jgi:hypothetical protein
VDHLVTRSIVCLSLICMLIFRCTRVFHGAFPKARLPLARK